MGMDLQYINVIQMLTKPNQTFESDKYHSSNVDGSFVTKKVVLANVFCVSFLVFLIFTFIFISFFHFSIYELCSLKTLRLFFC